MGLWNDCEGGVISTELVMVTSVLVAGVSAGLASLTNAVNTELHDVAAAVQSVNQSYGVSGVRALDSQTSGSGFVDLRDAEPPELELVSACTIFDEST